LTIDYAKCTRDGLCAADCPMNLITMTEKGPEPVPGAEKFCLNCGHCTAVCPHGALELQTMPLANCPPLESGWQLTPAQVETFLKGRRSIRAYKPEPVARELLAKIIDVARFAPTGGNRQSLSWTVIYDRNEVHRIAGAVIAWLREASQPNMPGAASLAWTGPLVAAWDAGVDPICRNAPHLILVHAPKEHAQMAAGDGMIALTFAELAALPYQVGTCWAGFVLMAAYRSPIVHAALQLPEGHQFLGGMMIGYPKMKYHRIPMRKEAHVIWR
jgi:nitroreductase/NAD-dependent dihydropyrimidine dehydrogenase PreA subunit